MTALPTALAAARLRLATQRPYLAAALWALQPVERPGLGTLAVDAYWRLYHDPAAVERWQGEHLAGVLYHEVCHLLRDHHGRAESVGADPRGWNIAGDAEINDDLRSEQVPLPEGAVYPSTLSQPDNRLAEEYYAALGDQARQSAPQQGQEAQSSPQGEGAAGAQADSASEQDPGAGPQRNGEGNPAASAASAGAEADPSAPGSTGGGGEAAADPASEAQPDSGGGPSPSQPGTAGGSQPGSGAGSTPASPSDQSPAASGHGDGPSQSAHRPGSGRTGGTDGTPSGRAAGQTPAPGAGHCGSCAHGHAEPWEELAPDAPGAAPGTSRAEAELLRRQVAEAIRVAASTDSRGTVPGHWRRWADARLAPPTVDWRRELAALCRRALADASGAADYSYRRPSRRQSVSSAILPALRQPVPQVAVVVDTSGSVGDDLIAQALGEVSGILRAAGQREGVTVLAVDAQVQTCRRVFRPQQVQLAGGGGTDMGAGVAAADHLRPRPQVCVVVTDGHTPWPDAPPRGMEVVVCLLGGGQAPEWARTVRAGKEV